MGVLLMDQKPTQRQSKIIALAPKLLHKIGGNRCIQTDKGVQAVDKIMWVNIKEMFLMHSSLPVSWL